MTFELRSAATSGGELAYVDFGDGPAVVLLHGFPTSSYLWRREIVLLSTRMRVVAPDLLGYGGSEKRAGLDLSLTAQTECLRELIRELGIERFAAVGHDFGGGVAQLLALGGGVDVLVLLDSIGFDAWPVPAVRALQATPDEKQTRKAVERAVRSAFEIGAKHEDLDEQALDAYLAPWRADPAAFFRAARGIDGRGLAGRESDLAALEIPTFLVWGEEDTFLPPEIGESLNELMPWSALALLPGCGHFVTEDAPATVAPLVFEWLRSRYLSESHGHPAGPVPVFLERPPERVLELGMEEELDS